MDAAAPRTPADARSVEDLVTYAATAAEPVKYLCFWGHRPRPDGGVGADCLSQWWPSPFTVDAVAYATAEHWMMAAKARLFGDPDAERDVLAAGHPAQAKAAGRTVRGFDEEVWRRERFHLVVEGSVHKFAADPALRDFLLGTGRRVLVEASPLDRIWGIGLAAGDPRAGDPAAWPGLNLLGFALMEARARLGGGGGAGGTEGAAGAEDAGGTEDVGGTQDVGRTGAARTLAAPATASRAAARGTAGRRP